jgi:hypothetical protein
MMRKAKPAGSSIDVSVGKTRVEGWTRSKGFETDLRKLRKYGILSAKTEPNIFGDNAVPRSKGG